MPQFPPPPGMQQPFYSFQVPQPPTLPPIDPNVYSMIFMDVLTRLPGWPGASGLPNGMQNSFQNGMQNGMQPGFFPLMNHMPAQMQSQPPGLIPMAPDSLPSVSDPPTPSLSRGSSVDIKGKGKAKAASYVSRGSSGSSKPIFSSSASIDNFFTSDSGEPLTFYVAIEVNRRSELLNQIKRHGGQISTQTSADFAILTSRSKDYETLLETVISSNGTAVKPAFVQDCVAQNMLLEHFQYQFELPEKLLRKVKKVTPRSPAKTDAEKKQAANMRKAKSRKVKKDVDIKTERSSPGPSRPHIPSPSPPPEHTRVSLKGNTYRYPQVEDEYLLKYAAVLFARDQQMSYSALATKLHRKMPHHSEKGWNHHITQSMRDEIEKVRKRAIIAYRKEQHTLSQQSSVDAPPAKRAKLSTSADDGPKAQGVSLEDEEHDLNTGKRSRA
ncbi:hypothetical protein C8R43DRAFT_713417 [Mycena crocata]|nr:hypothetical protein C8R43DRAFT_713417 [Mycena crocata]